MFKMSKQLTIAATASVLALSALALHAPAIASGSLVGGATLLPATAQMSAPALPTLDILPF
ncbi:hypothetical protein [Tsuneonella mangrovi]|uniref:hypothetical protein n=1 Tax=Tsuneonella mangrovi TaxID=1982042 RepID=UPI000BA20BB5|nr:hypothetical protein [Tsuneonella mangrovi]